MNEFSHPTFCAFNPRVIPYQSEVIDFLDRWDYATGTPEVLLSGSFGSAKSILMAHLAVRHCLENNGAVVAICRKALPDIKDTIFKEIIEHLSSDFVENKHYIVNTSTGKIVFWNGSEIISKSWADKKYKKLRSLKLSMVVIEELTENNEEDKEAFDNLKARLRRISHIKQNILICATNPDSPSHWVYKYFIDSKSNTRKVFYSSTEDNPFLEKVYIEQLKNDLDPKMARRLIYGEWVDIDQDRIYYAYDEKKNFIHDRDYQIDVRFPVIISFDFNIAMNKPMSSCAMQFDGESFHVFDEVVISGARTQTACEAWIDKELPKACRILIRGDATGEARDTRSLLSDYDIIKRSFSNAGYQVEMQVPRINPPIKRRHNTVNAYCENESGKNRLFVYRNAKVSNDGMKMTSLKKDGYIEDDSKPFQHITTAIGYAIVYETNGLSLNKTGSVER